MGVVLDTGVLISAALFKESVPSLCLQKVLKRDAILFSNETAAELIKTLNKPRLKKYIAFNDSLIFADRVLSIGKFIIVTIDIKECRDPKDNIFLELALSGNASCIITGDKDLLCMNPFRNIPIMTPKEYIDQE